LADNKNRALKLFKKVSKETCEYPFEIERKALTDELISSIENKASIVEEIKTLIHRTRALKKLAPVALDNLSEMRPSNKSHWGKFKLSWLLKFFRR
jgi:hypothetical protein